MKPIEFEEQTVVIAKGQPPYLPFPAHEFGDAEGRIAVCWQLSFMERLHVLFNGKVWQQMLTFNHQVQPQKLTVEKPDMQ
jgi:hypothetical protein